MEIAKSNYSNCDIEIKNIAVFEYSFPRCRNNLHIEWYILLYYS